MNSFSAFLLTAAVFLRVPDCTPPTPPPPPPAAIRILPFGDSITVGGATPEQGGFRVLLSRVAQADGRTIEWVGSYGPNGPSEVDGVPFSGLHDGAGGAPVGFWVTYAADHVVRYSPDIVLIHLGTNDLEQHLSGAVDRLTQLVDALLTTSPSVKVYVARVIPQGLNFNPPLYPMYLREPDTGNFNLGVDVMAATRPRVRTVDMYNAFLSHPNYSTELLIDGVHPTPAGYQLMAEEWWLAIQ